MLDAIDRVQLPERMGAAFDAVSGAILNVFPDGIVGLGGGTVLEARWNHRTSTDLDFFIAPANLSRIYDTERGYLYQLLLQE